MQQTSQEKGIHATSSIRLHEHSFTLTISVSLDRALEYVFRLLSGIEEDSRRFVEDLELREIIIKCCEEIRRLITKNDELLSDIKPGPSQWFK
jgi:hypothetical protein